MGKVTLPSDLDASGRLLGAEELELLREVLERGTLTGTRGTFVPRLEASFRELLGVRHVVACSSGTAAIHAALAALDPEPGDEIVTSPITDFGGVAPILWQGCIPVFADVDPHTCMVTASTLEPALSRRTRAIIVTHLFGHPAELPAILTLAESRGIPVIEDCSQAYLARLGGRPVGSWGAMGCFSLQQTKHMTTGEGGLVAVRDEALAARLHQFVNKARRYSDPQPEHYFLAMNYRMTELQAAVGVAQLDRLGACVARRQALARRLAQELAGLRWLQPARVSPGAEHSYWRYPLRVGEEWPGGVDVLAAALREAGVPCMPRYQRPAFEWAMMREQRTFGRSRYPFTLARPEALDYSRERFPGTWLGLERLLVLPWNERYTEAHVTHLAQVIRSATDRP